MASTLHSYEVFRQNTRRIIHVSRLHTKSMKRWNSCHSIGKNWTQARISWHWHSHWGHEVNNADVWTFRSSSEDDNHRRKANVLYRFFFCSCDATREVTVLFYLRVCNCCTQGANRAAEEAERERRDREDRLRHGRNPGARGVSAASGRPRGTQDGAPPTPLTPTSHTGQFTPAVLSPSGVRLITSVSVALSWYKYFKYHHDSHQWEVFIFMLCDYVLPGCGVEKSVHRWTLKGTQNYNKK